MHPIPLRKPHPVHPILLENSEAALLYKRFVPLGVDIGILFSIPNRAAVSRITFPFHRFLPMCLNNISVVGEMRPPRASEDKNMQNENRNEEVVSLVIATILMVASLYWQVYCTSGLPSPQKATLMETSPCTALL